MTPSPQEEKEKTTLSLSTAVVEEGKEEDDEDDAFFDTSDDFASNREVERFVFSIPYKDGTNISASLSKFYLGAGLGNPYELKEVSKNVWVATVSVFNQFISKGESGAWSNKQFEAKEDAAIKAIEALSICSDLLNLCILKSLLNKNKMLTADNEKQLTLHVTPYPDVVKALLNALTKMSACDQKSDLVVLGRERAGFQNTFNKIITISIERKLALSGSVVKKYSQHPHYEKNILASTSNENSIFRFFSIKPKPTPPSSAEDLVSSNSSAPPAFTPA